MIRNSSETARRPPEPEFFEAMMEIFASHLLEFRLQAAALTLVEIEERLGPDLPLHTMERLVDAHEVLFRLRMCATPSSGLSFLPSEFTTQH